MQAPLRTHPAHRLSCLWFSPGAVHGGLVLEYPFRTVFYDGVTDFHGGEHGIPTRVLNFWNGYSVPVAIHDIRLLGDAGIDVDTYFEVCVCVCVSVCLCGCGSVGARVRACMRACVRRFCAPFPARQTFPPPCLNAHFSLLSPPVHAQIDAIGRGLVLPPGSTAALAVLTHPVPTDEVVSAVLWISSNTSVPSLHAVRAFSNAIRILNHRDNAVCAH